MEKILSMNLMRVLATRTDINKLMSSRLLQEKSSKNHKIKNFPKNMSREMHAQIIMHFW